MSEQSQPPFHTEGLQSNPVAGTLLADSGPLSEGSHTFEIIVQATVSTRIDFEWRDANDAVKHRQPFLIPAASASPPYKHPADISVYCAQDDRFVLVVPDAVSLGDVHGSLAVA